MLFENKKTDEWQRVTTSGRISDNEWQRMTTSGTTNDNEWQRVVHQVTTHDNEWKRMKTSYKKWQWVTANGSEWWNKWIRISASKIERFYVSKETKGQSCSWIILFNFLCDI